MATLVYSLVSKLEALWGVGCASHPPVARKEEK